MVDSSGQMEKRGSFTGQAPGAQGTGAKDLESEVAGLFPIRRSEEEDPRQSLPCVRSDPRGRFSHDLN